MRNHQSTGEDLDQGRLVKALKERHKIEDPEKLNKITAVFNTALAKKKNRRYPNSRAFYEDLKQAFEANTAERSTSGQMITKTPEKIMEELQRRGIIFSPEATM